MGSATEAPESLFERCWWIYAICREHLFTDHTAAISHALTPVLHGSSRRSLVEVGCGPGFYSRRVAALFPHLDITGIDLSDRLLSRAREQARRARLKNCRFLKADAHSLAGFPNEIDAIIASRLFLVVSNRDLALQAMFESLRPGGMCFVVEPVSVLRASMPLWIMRAASVVSRGPRRDAQSIVCRVLKEPQFKHLVASQPWQRIRTWQDHNYQYALCEKAA